MLGPPGALTAMAVRRRSLPFMLSYAAVLAGCGDANPAISLRCTASTVRKFCATAKEKARDENELACLHEH